MNNVSFVLWVLLFPLSIRMNSYISFLMGRSLDEVTLSDGAAATIFVIWLVVAVFLYRRD